MLFVIVGILAIVLNLAGIGPTAAWNWDLFGDVWKFVAPFVLAALWWWWADVTGRNKRIEIERMDARKQVRREQNLQALGMDEISQRLRRQRKLK
jgi:small Trp-rich protein